MLCLLWKMCLIYGTMIGSVKKHYEGQQTLLALKKFITQVFNFSLSFFLPFCRVPSHLAWRPQPSLRSRGLGSPARSKIRPTPPLPAPLSLLEPRWPPAVPLASPCHSCCLSPLCCYHCCSPAPTPYVSIKTLNSHAATDASQLSYVVPFRDSSFIYDTWDENREYCRKVDDGRITKLWWTFNYQSLHRNTFATLLFSLVLASM